MSQHHEKGLLTFCRRAFPPSFLLVECLLEFIEDFLNIPPYLIVNFRTF